MNSAKEPKKTNERTTPSGQYIPKTHLIFQGYIPVHSEQEAMELYKDLKHYVESWSSEAGLNGQVVTNLEPCCGAMPKGLQNAKVPVILKR